jgi:hypothetical protein
MLTAMTLAPYDGLAIAIHPARRALQLIMGMGWVPGVAA